jgi:uncharacterized protein (DUF4415 family)
VGPGQGRSADSAGTSTIRKRERLARFIGEGKILKPEYNFKKGKRGPIVPVPKGKTRITIRIDDDVLEWFREQVDQAGGGNYQSLINQALRHYMQGVKEPLEVTLRRVIREELKKTG